MKHNEKIMLKAHTQDIICTVTNFKISSTSYKGSTSHRDYHLLFARSNKKTFYYYNFISIIQIHIKTRTQTYTHVYNVILY